MPKITEDLIRKRSEHNELQIGSLEELTLHQEGVEKLEHIQNWCKDLKILLLHDNLISKIENLGKLKKLEYVNFSQNNLERIENLEGCESLNKLDFTLNFIGELTSVESLKNNSFLADLYLTGNPCHDYEGYRAYVVATLPQLKVLDGEEILPSERIKALQDYGMIRGDIVKQQNVYKVFRENQRIKNRWKVDKWKEETIICCKTPLGDAEHSSEYWNEVSDHSPETRFDLTMRSKLSKEPYPGRDAMGNTPNLKPPIKLFNLEGKPLNINQAKVAFNLTECLEENCYKLDVAVYKHLDKALLQTDVEPFYVRVTIKKKVLQLVLMEEVNADASCAQRSQTTGHLVVTMPWVKQVYQRLRPIEVKEQERKEKTPTPEIKREFLEVGNEFDLKKMLTVDINWRPLAKKPPLIEDPDIPQLI